MKTPALGRTAGTAKKITKSYRNKERIYRLREGGRIPWRKKRFIGLDGQSAASLWEYAGKISEGVRPAREREPLPLSDFNERVFDAQMRVIQACGYRDKRQILRLLGMEDTEKARRKVSGALGRLRGWGLIGGRVGHYNAKPSLREGVDENHPLYKEYISKTLDHARKVGGAYGFMSGRVPIGVIDGAARAALIRSIERFEPERISEKTGEPVDFWDFTWLAIRRRVRRAVKTERGKKGLVYLDKKTPHDKSLAEKLTSSGEIAKEKDITLVRDVESRIAEPMEFLEGIERINKLRKDGYLSDVHFVVLLLGLRGLNLEQRRWVLENTFGKKLKRQAVSQIAKEARAIVETHLVG